MRYDTGDVEFEVEWYDRDISGGEERRIFKKWKPAEARTYTFNSTELRMIEVEMTPVEPVGGPPLDVVQRESRPTRTAAQQGIVRRQNATGITYQVHEQRAEPLDLAFQISSGSESLILHNCK